MGLVVYYVIESLLNPSLTHTATATIFTTVFTVFTIFASGTRGGAGAGSVNFAFVAAATLCYGVIFRGGWSWLAAANKQDNPCVEH